MLLKLSKTWRIITAATTVIPFVFEVNFEEGLLPPKSFLNVAPSEHSYRGTL